MKLSTFDDLIPQMRRAGFVATALAATISGSFGYSIGANIVEKTTFSVGLGLASFIVGYCLVAAYYAHQRGMPTIRNAAIALFTVAVCVEFLSHVGFTASHRNANVGRAELSKAAYVGKIDNVADLEAELNRLSGKYDWQRSMEPPDAYAAKIAGMKGDKLYKRSKSCTSATLEDSRQFCTTLASLEADMATSADRIAVQAEIKEVNSRLITARAVAESAPPEESVVADQGRVIAAAFTGTLDPTVDAQKWTNIGISALLALFFIMAGILNFIAFAFTGGTITAAAPSTPKARPVTYAEQLRSVQPAPVPTVNETHNHYIINDLLAEKAMAA